MHEAMRKDFHPRNSTASHRPPSREFAIIACRCAGEEKAEKQAGEKLNFAKQRREREGFRCFRSKADLLCF